MSGVFSRMALYAASASSSFPALCSSTAFWNDSRSSAWALPGCWAACAWVFSLKSGIAVGSPRVMRNSMTPGWKPSLVAVKR